jgi:plasmid stability protein
MAALNIDLPDELRSRLEARAAENGFDSIEAYAEAVLRADAVGGPVIEDEQLESTLLERLNGPFVDVDDADFRAMREKLRARLDGNIGGGEQRP